MMVRLIGLTLAVVLFLSSSQLQAAVLATVIAGASEVESGDGDFDEQLGFTTASASYNNPNGGSASAYATLTHTFGGGFSAKAFATATGGSGDDGQYVTNGGGAYAGWQDELHYTNTPEDVFVEFVFNFSGSKSGDATGSAEFFATDQNGNFLVGGSSNQTGTLSYGKNEQLPGAATHFINVSLSVHATGHGSGFGLPNTSTASFGHSFSLIAITPRDAAGNFLPDVVITASSGFDYNPLIMVVPEPTCAALGLIGVFVMFPQRRKAPVSKK
ncbi:MAG: hypothetical protein IT425_07035 [Pirellulales bacterium]|nr:hypothetical protein [Pirellulales bacterium]